MPSRCFTSHAIGALIAFALFAGCSSGASNVAPLATAYANAQKGTAHCCAGAKTLFVSDALGGPGFTGSVLMFAYPGGAYAGQLPAPPEGWSEPQGECVDDRGNVYIDNTSRSTIDEYSHSGTFVQALADPNQYPVDCAYDRSSGLMAVANILTASGGPGSISIYRGGVLQHRYPAPNMGHVASVGYVDDTGILWLDGADSSGIAQLDSFRDGIFTPIHIRGGRFRVGGSIEWSALTNSMNIGGATMSGKPGILHLSPKGKVIGKTLLDCGSSAHCAPVEFFIKGPRVTVTDAVALTVSTYPFPAGGRPVSVISGYFNQPIGVAVSSSAP